jgi:hypothetical protein
MDEHNYFQLNPVTDMGETLGVATQTRALSMKMSNFGALNSGGRMSTDYTRTLLDFEDKTDLENKVPAWLDAESNENPYVAGSTVKRVLDDQAFKMTVDDITTPGMDVSDTQAVSGAMTKGINYPTEGWRSFGGKYDFSESYTGLVR